MLHVFYQEEKYENKQNKNERKKKTHPERHLNFVLFPTLNYLKLAQYIPSQPESGHY